MMTKSGSETKLPPGVILAGGLARRMGGGDKGRLEIGGGTLLDHVINRLDPQVSALALNANGPAERFADTGLPVLQDTIGDFPGPLAGVLAGMEWAHSIGARCIVTAAADTPFFPRDLVARLQEAAGPSGLALAASGDPAGPNLQPTFGLWPVALRSDLEDALNTGLRKILDWTDRHDAGIAVFPANGRDPFFNVNRPEDLAQARQMR